MLIKLCHRLQHSYVCRYSEFLRSDLEEQENSRLAISKRFICLPTCCLKIQGKSAWRAFAFNWTFCFSWFWLNQCYTFCLTTEDYIQFTDRPPAAMQRPSLKEIRGATLKHFSKLVFIFFFSKDPFMTLDQKVSLCLFFFNTHSFIFLFH